MSNYCLSFRLDGTPPRLNQTLRMHWTKRNKLYVEWYKMVFLATRGMKPEKPLSKVRLTFIRQSPRFLDFDGVVGSLKPVVDGLIHAGIIADDAWPITGPWVVDQAKVPGDKACVKVMVEDLGEG